MRDYPKIAKAEAPWVLGLVEGTGPNPGPVPPWRSRIHLGRLVEKLAEVKYRHASLGIPDKRPWERYRVEEPRTARVLYELPAEREIRALLDVITDVLDQARQGVIQTVVETCDQQNEDGMGLASIAMIYHALGLEWSE